ncbi:N-acetyltransferase 10 [Klebsormidium nitens]|uniref:RNA cytidine acetyltransferase n=1 Tax=Klebsormidium nitens TaxID=105231 RepID=A0A1Y1HM03_KLENI|nr:N-acetyltransferase 10 [Klebsormidium nitens]|eukprot:GAQ78702.1 N-acetyltransferase 10 [Klebsormidium nitens]
MRKKVDSRIRTLVENGVKTRQRSVFVIIGDKGRDQVVNLHYMLSKAVVKARPSVLWCYKKDFHKKKRMKQVKKMMQRGLLDPENDDPFSLFMASTNIRYCYYAETHKILGNTFGMCVLQDFEALTPNLLARTVETVEGGGMIILLLSSLSSLSKLYTMTMDVHSRFRTESHADVTGRFNERFILSLAGCQGCVVMDDELNVLPISSHIRNIKPFVKPEGGEVLTEAERDLKELKESLKDTQPMGALVDRCKTLDQAKAVITFLDAASEKTLRSTVALTAARGRGKSAALGVAIAGAVALGYSNIFVTSPSPENLKTLFEFVFKGFDAMDYKEHIDYDLVESTNPAFNKAIVRVNIFRQHRQTIQYVQPQHSDKLAQAELLVIDEAAAIPLPVVKKLLGPYLVFLCSTVNGYEGTGRSLSLKLIGQLREQQAARGEAAGAGAKTEGAGRVFKEVELAEPIRYAAGDTVESWLNDLLCLNAADHIPRITGRLPHPSECELYYVNRDTLFSYHKASELFLQRMMALYVASHYKNTPNDLQLMSDAPAHHLFVLLGPVDESQSALPDVLAVVQVCMEGEISRQSALATLAQGGSPTGDLIPWTISQQFQDAEFPSLSGARVVRIACHPDLQRAGYGTRAMELLGRYYEGQLTDLAEVELEDKKAAKKSKSVVEAAAQVASLQDEQVKPRADLPPLLVSLAERRPEKLHYVGVSYGLTQQLFNFWKRLGMMPVYLRQTPNDITGEHTCIMLKALQTDEVESLSEGGANWVQPFFQDFKRRFLSLLGFNFRSFPPALALTIVDPKISFSEQEAQAGPSGQGIVGAGDTTFSPYDMKRLDSYSRNLVDYHLILDLVPSLSRLYFLEKLPATLSYGQAAILLSLGLQHQDLTDVEAYLKLPSSQILALFNKTIRKLHGLLHGAAAREIEAALPRVREVKMTPHDRTVDEDLEEGAADVEAAMREKVEALLQPEDLSRYAIRGDAEFEEALSKGGKLPKSGYLSVKSKGPANGLEAKASDAREGKRKDKDRKEGKKSKKAKG